MSEKMTIKYIVFDFDGTMADTFKDVLDIVNGLKTDKEVDVDMNDIKNYGISGLMKRARIPLWKLPKLVKDVLFKLRKKTDIKLFPNMPQILQELSRNYKLGIVSSNSSENISNVLRRYGIADDFDFIYSSSSIFGKHLILKNMCKKYKIKPVEILYVGDENRDIIGARKANIKTIAITWGYNSEKLLQKENPEYLARTPEEILTILSAMT
ncbi:MAG: HAD-IA family hydrolase [Parcubacteria group bacterium]